MTTVITKWNLQMPFSMGNIIIIITSLKQNHLYIALHIIIFKPLVHGNSALAGIFPRKY